MWNKSISGVSLRVEAVEITKIPRLIARGFKTSLDEMDLDKPVKKFMKTNPLMISLDQTLGEVAVSMAKAGRDVAVVVEGSQVMGLVTSHDVFDALKTYVLGTLLHEQTAPDLRGMRVETIVKQKYTKEFMEACGLTGTTTCLTLGEDAPIANAVRVMAFSGIDHILIMGEKGVVGTLSDDDLIKALGE